MTWFTLHVGRLAKDEPLAEWERELLRIRVIVGRTFVGWGR